MLKSVGMAIIITEANREKIAIVNGGVVPEADDTLYERPYFFFPYDYNVVPNILTEEQFFKKYRSANTQHETHFVDVDQI